MRIPARSAPPTRPRFLSEADCQDIATRLARYATGGGETDVHILSRWTGNVRWARNRIISSGEDRNNRLMLTRMIRGAANARILINEATDGPLIAAARRAERLIGLSDEAVESDLGRRPDSPFRYQDEPVTVPNIFFESTYQQNADRRAATARQLIQAASAAGMLSAGYLQVTAASFAIITSWGYTRYFQYTWAQASMTVRDPKGTSSGWAGVDWPDWNKIDGAQLAATALEKCLASRNPVTVEPGRYTTILEPQAVGDFLGWWGCRDFRQANELDGQSDSFHKSGHVEPLFSGSGKLSELGLSRLGDRVIDERITLRADPLDPELMFPPYDKTQDGVGTGPVYHPVTYIERGVLKNLAYPRTYAIELLGKTTSLEASGALRMSVEGQTTTIPEMIATTTRGLLVTRFSDVEPYLTRAKLCRGYTRDGLWLIEHGKISKPVKNMVFTESILGALNNVDQLGVPQRVFHPEDTGELWWYENPTPLFVPALKIRDFSFTALTDAV